MSEGEWLALNANFNTESYRSLRVFDGRTQNLNYVWILLIMMYFDSAFHSTSVTSSYRPAFYFTRLNSRHIILKAPTHHKIPTQPYGRISKKPSWICSSTSSNRPTA